MAGTWNKYEPTAARRRSKPGREIRPRSITVDFHAHVGVPAVSAFAAPHLNPLADPLSFFASDETKAVNQMQGKDIGPRISQHDQRLRDLDAMGIDVQVALPPPPQCFYTVPLEIAVKSAQMLNDGIAEYCAKKPDRFVGFATVPMPDGNEAAKELERAMKVHKFKGAQILTNVAGKELSDPAFAPFWKKAEELGAFIVIHPNGFTEAKRFSRFYFNNIIGNPLETTIALHYLIFDGVFERHPKLKVLAVHGGGYLGGYWGRIDHAWGARSDCHTTPKPPTHYLRQNVYFDNVVFTHDQLVSLVKTFGADRILLGTDYPFDMADYDPVEHVVSSGFDAATTAAICGGNAKKILGL